MKIVGEGAEALIYTAQIYGDNVIIKYRQQKRYRINVLDTNIRKARTKKEAKMLARAASAGVSVPALIGVGTNEIYMEKIEGKLLKDTNITKQHAAELGELLGKLHNAGITHGDFTPANIIESGKGLYVIDFGLSDPNQGGEERALDVLLMKRQIEKELYDEFSKSYSKVSKSGKEVLRRLKEVEERGRYQIRTLA